MVSSTTTQGFYIKINLDKNIYLRKFVIINIATMTLSLHFCCVSKPAKFLSIGCQYVTPGRGEGLTINATKRNNCRKSHPSLF
jgi:hypothetical protein